jgi:radical SAM protein with 4Fe4S-binding SPASM domain
MTSDRQVTSLKGNPGILWKKGKPLLLMIDIELTERCNNDCIHCCINLPEKDTKARERELTTPEWKEVIDQAAALGALTVRFTGGEPLLREDFIDLYLYARRKGMRVLLFTNARLITPDIAELFSRIPPLEDIEVTVYGLEEESSIAVTRSREAFTESRQGINLLLKHKIPFVVRGTVLPSTIDEMDDFITWAARIPWQKSQPNFPLFLDLRHRRDSEAKNRLIRQLRLTPEQGLKILTRDPDSYRRDREKFCRQNLREPGPRLFNCNAHNAICVDTYGKIQYCLALRHPETVLDIHRNSLREMLTEFIPRLRQRESINSVYLERCGRCFLRGLCEQCPAKSWIEHGSLDQPVDYLCQVAHEQAAYLGILTKNEKSWEVTDWRGKMKRLTKTK